jgi:bifunctional N-acetylglucosamine-1-phosphate-uridyltransferase/glucosamine-1-phosphate-acetyltransferase GlmU-like protein
MKIIIPMAGIGERFVKAGYIDPKPLINVNGKLIIEYIVEMFDIENDEFIFVINEEHANNTKMVEILNKLVKQSEIYIIQNHKKGPVYTLKNLNVKNDEEVIITYCDNPYLWDYNDFKQSIKNSDGCILSHVGFHPHRLSPTFMAYIKETNGKLIEIKEKEPYTLNPIKEHASTGTYYFAKGEYVKKYFKQLMELDINYNGEYYVTLVYNLMVNDGLNVTIYDTDYVSVFGTPEEVQNFEAWQTILKSGVNTDDELVASYRYWENYNKQFDKLK